MKWFFTDEKLRFGASSEGIPSVLKLSQKQLSQQTQKICITFAQRRPNVFDVAPTLNKCYANVLCLLCYGCRWILRSSEPLVFSSSAQLSRSRCQNKRAKSYQHVALTLHEGRARRKYTVTRWATNYRDALIPITQGAGPALDQCRAKGTDVVPSLKQRWHGLQVVMLMWMQCSYKINSNYVDSV